MRTLAVIIPSRAGPRQHEFLTRALGSIGEAMALSDPIECKILIGLDAGVPLPPVPPKVTLIESSGTGQAKALNACLAVADADLIAFLEDDDQWTENRLSVALDAIEGGADFTSCTQLEVNDAGEVIRINDFPTPSGWLFTRVTLDRVGLFDESYRYHLDNDWLGRLTRLAARRVHLVECTAPIDIEECRQVRPWLANCIDYGDRRIRTVLKRHLSPYPLVTRLVHPQSGMARLDQQKSSDEYRRLAHTYGRVPW
jgi:glycosyltransferase involved in cell wall biosynthesis